MKQIDFIIGINFIFVDSINLLTLANHSQMEKILRTLFSLWVICWSLHIDKIQ